MKGNREDKRLNDKSYFAVKRRRIKRNLKIIIPVSIVVIGVAVGLMFMGDPSVQSNKMLSHNHIQLNVTLNGKPIEVPSGIGIKQMGVGENSLLYGDHTLDQYGMDGMSPLHTHDDSGLIHVESNTVRNFKLGEFLSIWRGLDTNGKVVKASVRDTPVSDFQNIVLNDGEKIKLEIMS